MLKLNLGCGARRFDGFVNVDKYGEPDVRLDLEKFPWPWKDSSVDEVKLIHVLEHLGGDPDVFIGIMKEMYRVCAPGARIGIIVPHPRHDNFIGDPTHVRPVTSQMLALFDRAMCEEWQRIGAANSPLAIYHGVDFHVIEQNFVLEEPYSSDFREGRLTAAALESLARSSNNVISEIHITLEARK